MPCAVFFYKQRYYTPVPIQEIEAKVYVLILLLS